MDAILNSRQAEKLAQRLRGAGGGVLKRPLKKMNLVPLKDTAPPRRRSNGPPVTDNSIPDVGRRRSRRISRTPPGAAHEEPSALASPPKRQKLDHPISTASPLRDRPTALHRSPERRNRRSASLNPIAENSQGRTSMSRGTTAAITTVTDESPRNGVQPETDTAETPFDSRTKKAAAVATVTPVRGAKRRRQPSPDKFLTPAGARANRSFSPAIIPPRENDYDRAEPDTPNVDVVDENEHSMMSKVGDDVTPMQAHQPTSSEMEAHAEVEAEAEVLIESPDTTPDDMTPTRGSLRRSTRRSPLSNERLLQSASTRISQPLTPETAGHLTAAEEEEEEQQTPTPAPVVAKKGRGRPARRSQDAVEIAKEKPVGSAVPEIEAGNDSIVSVEETPTKQPVVRKRGRPPRSKLSLDQEEVSALVEENAQQDDDRESVSSLEGEQTPPPDESVLPIEDEADAAAESAEEDAEEEEREVDEVAERETQAATRTKKGGRKPKAAATAARNNNRAEPAPREPRTSDEGVGGKAEFLVYRPAKSSKTKLKFASGVNAVDVVSQALQETVDRRLTQLQQQRSNIEGREEKKRLATIIKAIGVFGDEAELQFMRNTQEYDNYVSLQNTVRRTERKKAALSKELMDLRKQREDVAREMDDIRKSHELGSAAAENQRRLNHDFQALEGVVARGQSRQEKIDSGVANDFSYPDLALGLSATLKSLAQDLSSGPGAGSGVLEKVREFNNFLEAANTAVEAWASSR